MILAALLALAPAVTVATIAGWLISGSGRALVVRLPRPRCTEPGDASRTGALAAARGGRDSRPDADPRVCLATRRVAAESAGPMLLSRRIGGTHGLPPSGVRASSQAGATRRAWPATGRGPARALVDRWVAAAGVDHPHAVSGCRGGRRRGVPSSSSPVRSSMPARRSELTAIVAHEAAHVAARDNLVRLLFHITPGADCSRGSRIRWNGHGCRGRGSGRPRGRRDRRAQPRSGVGVDQGGTPRVGRHSDRDARQHVDWRLRSAVAGPASLADAALRAPSPAASWLARRDRDRAGRSRPVAADRHAVCTSSSSCWSVTRSHSDQLRQLVVAASGSRYAQRIHHRCRSRSGGTRAHFWSRYGNDRRSFRRPHCRRPGPADRGRRSQHSGPHGRSTHRLGRPLYLGSRSRRRRSRCWSSHRAAST